MEQTYMDYLAHHGVKGQKWGVRRYQNDDGTLTEAGRKKYGNTPTYKDNALRRTVGGDFGQGTFHKMLMNRQERKMKKAQERGNGKSAEKWRSKLEAYKAAEANQQAYRNRSSTAKLLIQNLAMTPVMAMGYRHARARGESRASALLEANPITAAPVRIIRDRKAYGHYVAHSDTD